MKAVMHDLIFLTTNIPLRTFSRNLQVLIGGKDIITGIYTICLRIILEMYCARPFQITSILNQRSSTSTSDFCKTYEAPFFHSLSWPASCNIPQGNGLCGLKLHVLTTNHKLSILANPLPTFQQWPTTTTSSFPLSNNFGMEPSAEAILFQLIAGFVPETRLQIWAYVVNIQQPHCRDKSRHDDRKCICMDGFR